MKLRYGEVIDLCLHRDTVSLLMERIAILTDILGRNADNISYFKLVRLLTYP